MSSRRIRFALAIMVVFGLVATSIAVAASRDHGKSKGKNDKNQFTAHLIGYNEVPAINSAASADLSLAIGSGQLTYTLTYAGFSGTAPTPTAAHVHIGQPGVNGGVSFFLCGGGTKPACSSGSGTITGTVLPSDIQAIAAQGFAAGDLNAVIAAIQAGVSYANMHSTTFPGGEIRGQLEPGHGHGHGSDNDD